MSVRIGCGLLLLASCKDKGDTGVLVAPSPKHWTVISDIGMESHAMAVFGDGVLLVAGTEGLLASEDGGLSWEGVAAEGLAEGTVTFLHAFGEDGVLAWVHGAGLHRSIDRGIKWNLVQEPPQQPLMSALNPRGQVVPFGMAEDERGWLWLAGVGGLFVSKDQGDVFSLASTSDAGALNVLFADVAVEGDQILAVSQLANSILPASYQGLLSGRVFYSDDAGASWTLLDEGLDALAPMGAAFFEGEPCIAAMDGGVFCHEMSAWTALGGPSDAVALRANQGGLSVGSATRGVWQWDGAGWTAVNAGAMATVGAGHALAVDGQVLATRAEQASPPAADPGQGVVHIALSFHTNLYHSYRGDTNDEDGYGKDIRVIRTVLDWLDAHPTAHADWDIENHFSLDGWLASEAPDIIERLQTRVDAGQDDVRIMSWNNGAMASSTEEEFRQSVRRAQDSYAAVFSEQVPGVQPQECMFTPDHIGWYREEGIDWITLFYAANGFTAMREDVSLSGAALYNPVTLVDGEGGAEMTWVPAYHHADVLEHGGLSAWARQIRAQGDGDTLLLVHFDADAESWENFGTELDRLREQEEAGEVVFTTIQDYLDTHDPVETVTVYGDVADGTGDGFQSWAEKDLNHRLATQIFAARELADQARALGEGDAAVEAQLEVALTPRLLALSTTHFGLAAPYLAEERVASAWAYADQALADAGEAFALADALWPLEPGEVHVLNHRPHPGTALVEWTLHIPKDQWMGLEHVAIYDWDGAELSAGLDIAQTDDKGVDVAVSLVMWLDAGESRMLRWEADAPAPRALGAVSQDAFDDMAFATVLTECGGTAQGAALTLGGVEVDDRQAMAHVQRAGTLPMCDETGTVVHTLRRHDGLPGVVVSVDAQLPDVVDPESLESIALSVFSCGDGVESIQWQTFGGQVRTRPMRPGVETWNGQSVDGWMGFSCADGQNIQLSHRVMERSSLGLAPLRDRGGATMIAPLGTLWGDSPWHGARRTGGSGMGDVITALVGSQYRPAAPDWSGQSVSYRLLVGDGSIDVGTLDLFAHPPLVRVP